MTEKERKISNNSQEENESEESETSETSIELNTLIIKKETSKTITIDNDSYEKLISFLQDVINNNKILKDKLNKSYLSESIQTEINFNDIENNLNENNKNSIKDFENKNKELIDKLNNSEKNNEKYLKEIEQLKLDLKNQNEQNNNKINKLEKENNDLQNEIKKLKENGQNNNFKEIYSNKNLLNYIIKYLKNRDIISLSKVNNKLWNELFYKTKSEIFEKKLKQKIEMINNFNNEDIYNKFKVNEKEIEDLLIKYIINDNISGKEIRNEIVNSQIFLTQFVKIPLKNLKEQKKEDEKIKNTKNSFFNRFVSVLKGEDEEEEENIFNLNENEDAINNYYNTIKFTEEEFKNLYLSDRKILETYNTDKTINVKFEYEKSDKIKDLLNEFFKSQLPKISYQKFLSKICEIFSDLLYASFLSLKDIKNLEIVKYVLYCRYMKSKIKIEELNSEIQDLNQFAESSKEIKEMLMKQKQEVDIKYNNSLMIITQLNEEKGIIQKKCNELENELNNSSKKFDDFKIKISNEYNKIKKDFDIVYKEKDLLKETLLDFKNYFMKFIGNDGELIEN